MSEQNKIQRKVKEIADRIFLEKFREKKDNQDYYVVSLEMKKFAQLYFTANFTGSKNITFLNGENYIQKTEVLPYTKKEVARLLLNKGWNLKTKFSFTLGLPAVEIQQEFLNQYEQEISSYLRVHKYFQNVDFISFKESQIQNYFQQKNTTFIDLDFPPMDSSIEKNKQKILSFYESLIHWRRIEDIVDNPPGKGKIPVLYEGINPTDVKTGKLQDYWLLSSISAIAERPELVRKIILSKQYNKFGLYKVKLRKMGFWVTMIIDSYFPCFPEGNPIFGSSKNANEMWILLIEKAYAKMYGRYGRLKTGKPNQSLYDLTGYPVFTYRFYDKEIYNQITSGEFWNKLKKWDKLKYILTASTQDIKSSQVTGVVQENTYTILDIQEHDDVKLLLLRNPWGVFEWDGDYSKDSDKWTQSLIMKLKPDQIQDSSFWISYEHFLQNYEILNVCKTKKWFEVSLKGKFIKGIDSRYQLPYFCSRYCYKLSVLQKGKVIIGVHQEDERFKGVVETRPYIDIGIVVIKKHNGKYELIGKKDSEMEREVFFEINLTPGEYLVLPRSEGVVLNFQRENVPKFTYFDMSSQIVKSVVNDLFAKYDLDGNQELTIDDIEKLFQKCGMKFDIKNFKEVLQGQKDWHIFSIYEFRTIFDHFLKKTDFEQQKNIFKALGYDENLFSYRSRVISMSFHSSHSIQVENDDSFTQCLDMIARQLIIQKYGKNIDHNAEDLNEHKEVEAYHYFNKRIHCYSYSIFNRTNQPITATLDLSESENMITDHALKITKQIPPYTLEFIMSCQSKQKAEKYFRSAMLSWEQQIKFQTILKIKNQRLNQLIYLFLCKTEISSLLVVNLKVLISYNFQISSSLMFIFTYSIITPSYQHLSP